jgi:tRNA(adenine34) deaminase
LLLPGKLRLRPYMKAAFDEACLSHREGNHGFGAVILHDGEIVSQAHDTEETDQDATAHAELKVIQAASCKLGRNLSGCCLICTHEPCPMCATAVVWSGITIVAYGCSISNSIRQGRSRIDIECMEIFRRAKADIQTIKDLMHSECAVLYDQDVRAEIRKLRGASDDMLLMYDKELSEKRVRWFQEERIDSTRTRDDMLMDAYRVLLKKFCIEEDQAPIVRRNSKEIVFRSMNFCPTLEACKILGLDTRKVCKLYNERSTDALVKLIDPKLEFVRNYQRLRPDYEYCEEIIRYSAQ